MGSSTRPTVGGGSYGPSNNPSGVSWLVPCKYLRVTSPFGYRWHPTTGEWSMHRGVDLGAYKGTPIYASRSGTITIATYHSTAGNYVQINHGDGYCSVYMHMTHYVVKLGDYVKAGELIGYVGSTGRSTGPHLHFGISYKGEYVNPMDYIG
jgi:murein DD-endopeptidase MepM/ murein hydrolase activator NlpD